MAYLRGPLTKDEIRRLAAPPPAPQLAPGGTVVMATPVTPVSDVASRPSSSDASALQRPVLPPDVPEVFFPTTLPRPPLYRPVIVGAAKVHFEDERTGLDYAREVMFVTPIVDGPLPVRWEDSKWAGAIGVRELTSDPAPSARFEPLPAPALAPKSYAAWSKELAKWLARTQGIARMKSPKHKLFSQPGEDERSFRARLALLGREARDEETLAVRDKLSTKLATLEERIRRQQEVVARGEEQAGTQRMDAALSAGGGLLGAFFGRTTAKGVVSGAAKAARSASRASTKARSVAREKEDLATLYAKHAELQREAQAAVAKVASTHDPSTVVLENVVTKPKKTGITIHLVALAWQPCDQGAPASPVRS